MALPIGLGLRVAGCGSLLVPVVALGFVFHLGDRLLGLGWLRAVEPQMCCVAPRAVARVETASALGRAGERSRDAGRTRRRFRPWRRPPRRRRRFPSGGRAPGRRQRGASQTLALERLIDGQAPSARRTRRGSAGVSWREVPVDRTAASWPRPRCKSPRCAVPSSAPRNRPSPRRMSCVTWCRK